jgi:enoyl-CoA hydratase/carnithine racemase
MIELEDRDEIAVLRMVRGKGNALNEELLTALIAALDRLERSSARAAVITGQGNVFSAGVDLAAVLEDGPAYVRRFLPLLSRVFERFATFPKPLVAAVNGHAIAGGAIIMMACDARLLARGSARIGLTEIQVGVIFPAWALEIARFTVAAQHFPTLVYSGHTYLPDESVARGLVDELVESEKLLDRSCQVASELGAIPTAKFTATKLAVRRPLIDAARSQSLLTNAAVIDDWCSPETQRLIASFFERTVKKA